jgi:hypothetical protein
VKIFDLYEIQIYDTASLLAVAPLETVYSGTNRPKANWQTNQPYSSGIKKTGDTSFESISACVTGIPYLAESWHNKTQADLASVSGRKSLDFTCTFNGATSVTIVSAGETFANLVNGTGGKYNVSLSQTSDRKLYLQSHWGSGVVFQNITLQKLQ